MEARKTEAQERTFAMKVRLSLELLSVYLRILKVPRITLPDCDQRQKKKKKMECHNSSFIQKHLKHIALNVCVWGWEAPEKPEDAGTVAQSARNS